MKAPLHLPTSLLLTTVILCAGQSLTADQAVEGQVADLSERSSELAEEQDELAADVMELAEEQTVPQVITLLNEVEVIMGEVVDELFEDQTGGETLAAQTEIIEKIFDAAQKRQQQSQSSSQQSQENMGAMLEMMERMLGKEPTPSEQPAQKPGSEAGEGGKGESDLKNDTISGDTSSEGTERTVPRGTGNSELRLPQEFQPLLDAYNRNS